MQLVQGSLQITGVFAIPSQTTGNSNNISTLADFSATPTTGTAPLSVQFTDESTHSPTAWGWTFGDGNTSRIQNPSHIYTSAGTYDVSLTVSNADGSDSEVKEGFVEVIQGNDQLTYSVTYVENYPGNRSLNPVGDNAAYEIGYYLNKAGWRLIFEKGDSDVTKEDLGSQGGGLNEATFHYHFGHGGYLVDGLNTSLELLNGEYVFPWDVQNKWGGNNKWVFLQSCYVLADPSWGNALNTTHGIFGYKTEVGSNTTVVIINDFFHNAIDQNQTLLDSYENATCYGVRYMNDTNVTAAVIFRNEQEAMGDHLPRHGTIEPDANPSDVRWRTDWPC